MIDRINLSREKCAKFRKVDLHLHSPRSHDWDNSSKDGYQNNPVLDRELSDPNISEDACKAYAEYLIESGIEVAAITDHMKTAFGLTLAKYVQNNCPNLLVLPGIELNVRLNIPLINETRIHVLAIFPVDTPSEKIERIFPGDDYCIEAERDGKTDEVKFESFKDLAETIRKNGGFSVAAHVDTDKGVRCAFTKKADLILKPLIESDKDKRDEFYRNVGDSLKPYLFEFDCIQVSQSTKPHHYQDENRKLIVPLILASDSHSVSEFGSSEKISYIKMGELSFKCLKEAFCIPDTRIRFYPNLPECIPPRIKGVRITGTQDNEKSFFKDLTLGFSDNLTCIVGPRGSGKSTLVDAIRYAMGYNRTLDEIEKGLRDQIIKRQEHTLSESRIEILYEKDVDTEHKIASTFHGKTPYTTTVCDAEDNELNIRDVEKCGEYPLNLFGWNELEFLGAAQKTQREMLDKFIPSVSELLDKRKKLYDELEANGVECIDQSEKLETFFDESMNAVVFIRLKEYEREYQKYNTPEIEKKFEAIDELKTKINFLNQIENDFDELKSGVDAIREPNFDDLKAKNDRIKDWIIQIFETIGVQDSMNDISQKVKELISSIESIISKISPELENLKGLIEKNKKEIREATGNEEEIILEELRNRAKRKYDEAGEQLENYKDELALLYDSIASRKDILGHISELNHQLFNVRNSEKEKIIAEIGLVFERDFKIGLVLNKGKDRDLFLQNLSEGLIDLSNSHRHWKSKKFPAILSDALSPLDLSKAFLHGDSKKIVHSIKEGDEEYCIPANIAEKIVNENIPYEEIEDFGMLRFSSEKLGQIFSIEQIPFDDQFYITLNTKPIQDCSPGQRCSAMLPIVTLTSNAPIIIDQPEDNLDNRLVSRAIFKILSELKETRQIILATHNPNILVSGDAEQVIVMDGYGEISDYGSIDSPSIIQHIVDLMEGGEEAFKRREDKYNLSSSA